MKRILFATSEAVPFIKTGGLADVAGSLPKCFDKRYFDIRVILPKYACMKQEWKDKMDFVKYSRLNLPGQKCIDFTVKGHDGKEIRLSDLLAKNKLVLIDFWASWCGACRATMPHLKDIYPEYKKKGVEFFSVSLDDKEENWKKAFKEEALPWIDGSNLLGWKDPIAKQYAITGIPFKILIGKDGVIVDKGFARSGSLEKAMDEYLNKVK